MNQRPDISALTALITQVEGRVSCAQDAVSVAASCLARLVGPLATAHRLAELAIEFAELADQERPE
nr:MAG TPA: hypothetical protein [Caudoviricetes sp.]